MNYKEILHCFFTFNIYQEKNAKKQLEGRDTAIQTSMSSNNCIYHLSKQNKKPTIVSAIVEK